MRKALANPHADFVRYRDVGAECPQHGYLYRGLPLRDTFPLWAGWKYVTAGGGGGWSAAREIFTNVLVGLVIILAAWLIVDTIMRAPVNENATIGPWNKMC